MPPLFSLTAAAVLKHRRLAVTFCDLAVSDLERVKLGCDAQAPNTGTESLVLVLPVADLDRPIPVERVVAAKLAAARFSPVTTVLVGTPDGPTAAALRAALPDAACCFSPWPELALPGLLAALATGAASPPPTSVPASAPAPASRPPASAPGHHVDPDSLPLPAWELADLPAYASRRRLADLVLPVATARDGTWSATGAVATAADRAPAPVSGGSGDPTAPLAPLDPTRLRAPRKIIEEVRYLAWRFEVKRVRFVGHDFAVSPDWTRDLSARLARLPVRVHVVPPLTS
jgi:hypothetical protein